MNTELFDHALERTLIGTLADVSLTDVGAARLMLEQHQLSPSDFHLPAHGELYGLGRQLLGERLPIALELVAGRLKTSRIIADAGGLKFLGPVLIQGWTNERAYPGYVRIVRELAVRRRMVDAGDRLRVLATNREEQVDASLSEVSQRIARLTLSERTHLVRGEELVVRTVKRIEAAHSGEKLPCVLTGVDLWDQVFGGLEKGTLIFIGACPGVGKTALTSTMVRNIATRKTRVGVFSAEDPGDYLPNRFLAHGSAVPLFTLAKSRVDDEQLARVHDAAVDVYNFMRHVVVDERKMLTASQVEQSARSMVVNEGCEVLVLEHLGKIDFESSGHHRDDLAVEEGLNRFSAVAADYGVPFVIAAHLKGGDKDDDRFDKPTSRSFARTEYIRRDARTAAGLYLDKKDPDALNVVALKQNHGEVDVVFQLRRLKAAGLVSSENGKLDGLSYGDQERQMLEAKKQQGFVFNPDEESGAA